MNRTIARKVVSQPVLKLIAEIFVVISVAAGFTSIVFNSVVFSKYGFSFVSVATPSDILMSGLRMAYFLVQCIFRFWLVPILLCWYLIYLKSKVSKEKVADDELWFASFSLTASPKRISFYKDATLILLIIYALLCSFEIRLENGRLNLVNLIGLGDGQRIYANIFGIGSVIHAIIIILLILVLFNTEDANVKQRPFVNIVAINLITIICSYFVLYVTYQMSNSKIVYESVQGKTICASSNSERKVMWIGEESVLIKCSKDDFRIASRSDLVLISSRSR